MFYLVLVWNLDLLKGDCEHIFGVLFNEKLDIISESNIVKRLQYVVNNITGR